jgi:DinB superfamily
MTALEKVGKMRAVDSHLRSVVDLLDEAFDKKSWHGPNLRASLRGLTPSGAAWRPAPGHHNIWELMLHAAYWKYAVRRRITGEKRGSFVLAGTNFFERPLETTEAAWNSDVGILVNEHQALRLAVLQLPPTMAEHQKKWQSTLHLLRGAAAHDLYHAGQIRLLRRICPLEPA